MATGKAKRARKPKRWETYLKQQARRIWGWTLERKEVKARTKVGTDDDGNHLFRCEACPATELPRDSVQIDHVAEVDCPTGWDEGGGWDGWLARLFCPASELMMMCLPCHQVKTQANQRIRRATKKAAKDVV